MIHSVFELGDTLVREVMVPRTDMVFIERDKTLRQALSLALRSGFSPHPGGRRERGRRRRHRLPQGHRAPQLRAPRRRVGETVESVMRPAAFVPDSKPVDELLREMQARADPHGHRHRRVRRHGRPGHDRGHPRGDRRRDHRRVRRRDARWSSDLDDGSVRVSARLHVDELAELFDVELEDDDVDTVGGLLAKHLGRVPIAGAHGRASTAAADRRERPGPAQPDRHRRSSAASTSPHGPERRRGRGDGWRADA